MDRKRVLHFGLQRAGTNYLKELLIQYFEVDFVNEELDRTHPLHKHFRLYKNKDLIANEKFRNDTYYPTFKDLEINTLGTECVDLCIFISKDPYSWYLSYRKWGRKNNWPAPAHHEILEYVEFHRQWLKFAAEDRRIVHIRYADLLKNPDEILVRLEEQYDLLRLAEPVQGKRIQKVPMSHRFSRRKHRYYTRKKYLKELTRSELDVINNLLDEGFLNELGYRKFSKKGNI